MRVVFLENVPNVAHAGEIKEVAAGYGRNYLLPRKLAAVATPALLKQLEEQHRAEARRAVRLEVRAEELGQRLSGLTVTMTPKVGAQGRLYGSVTNAHIAAELEKLTGHSVDRRRVLLANPIRRLGSYPVEVRLTSDVAVTVMVEVTTQAQAQAGPVAQPPAAQLSEPAAEQSGTPPEEPGA